MTNLRLKNDPFNPSLSWNLRSTDSNVYGYFIGLWVGAGMIKRIPCECGFYDRDRHHTKTGGGKCNAEPWKPTTNLPLPHRRLELCYQDGTQGTGWHDGATWFPICNLEIKEWRYYKMQPTKV